MTQEVNEEQIVPEEEKKKDLQEPVDLPAEHFSSAEEIEKASYDKLSALKALYVQQLGLQEDTTANPEEETTS